MEIFTGEYKILTSGIFHAIAKSETKFVLQDLTIKFQFEDKEGESPNVKTSSDGKSAVFTFINFFGPLGVGNTDLIKIGTFEHKELWLSYRITSLDDKTLRTFEYTFYQK